MPGDADKQAAGIEDLGEARRVTIRRARPDRDGLFLFGRRTTSQTLTLTTAEIDALRRGRTIAVDARGDSIVYLRRETLDPPPPRQSLSSKSLGTWIVRTTSGAQIRLDIQPTLITLIRHGTEVPPDPFSGQPHIVHGFTPLRLGEAGLFIIEGWGRSYRTSPILYIDRDEPAAGR